MNQQANFPYANVDDILVLEMPYGAGDLSTIVLLPKRVGGLSTLEAALTASNVNRWIAALNRQNRQSVLAKVPAHWTVFPEKRANLYGHGDGILQYRGELFWNG